MDKENKVYFEGVVYDSLEEMMSASIKYYKSPLSQQTVDRILLEMVRKISLNILLSFKTENGTNEDLIRFCDVRSDVFIIEWREFLQEMSMPKKTMSED